MASEQPEDPKVGPSQNITAIQVNQSTSGAGLGYTTSCRNHGDFPGFNFGDS